MLFDGVWARKAFFLSLGFLAFNCRSGLAQGNSIPTQISSASAPCALSKTDSAFIPVDSWIYPAVLRLYSMGYLHSVYIGERPWTRDSIGKMLDQVAEILDDARNYDNHSIDEAQKIYDSLVKELHYSPTQHCLLKEENLHIESVYSATRVLTGTTLRDSFHLGSTLINDYGRPYANGVNNYTGFSGTATAGRFLVYLRGEFQETPSTTGYSPALAQYLSETVDVLTYINPATGLPYYQATIPAGEIAGHRSFNPLEAYVSTRLWNHEVSFGRKDEWLSPAQGGAFAYSNNAENLYALHIDRLDPLYVPGLSRLTGPFHYVFMVGELQGHTYMQPTPGTSNINWVNPGKPWMHLEKVSFKPSSDFELSFERTVIWGGQGHEGISLHSFLRSFFSVTAGADSKNTNEDPGARFGTFDLSYRLPFVRNWMTLYADGLVHDDLSPIDAPRRAAWRPGLYLSHLPHLQHLDLRVEGATTAPPVRITDPTHQTAGYVQDGNFLYWEGIVRQGYTNNGQIFGDWIGREDKGGQAWATWHLSGNEWIQASFRRQKATADFISGGTTLDDFGAQIVKRIGRDFELNGAFTREQWKAPIYRSGPQNVTATTVQLTWHPAK
jgi:hypothetical protein